MGTGTDSPHAELLAAYQHAWSVGDADAIADMMTPDGLYEASFGPHPYGERYQGREAVRAAVKAMRARSTAPWNHEYADTHIFGDRAVATWTSRSTGPDGEVVVTHGCDLYEFRDGQVDRKIAFRKGRA